MLKYQQIASDIEKYIVTHELQQGDKLPVLETLMSQFAVSKSTIIKSLDLLEKRNYLSSEGQRHLCSKTQAQRLYQPLSNQGFKKI